MIITSTIATNMYNRLDKLKSISKLGIELPEWLQWCHTVNVINALETDDCIIGSSILDKFSIEAKIASIILPYEVTYDGTDRCTNLLDESYSDYKPENHGYASDLKPMKPADFNEVSDVLMAAFRKSSNPESVGTLKIIASLDDYAKRAAYDESCMDSATRFVPVELSIALTKEKFLNEDSQEMFELWWVDTLRAMKSGSNPPEMSNK